MDSNDFLDRLRLHRQGDSRAVVLVEGSPDKSVLRRVLDADPFIFPLGPKHVVLNLLRRVLCSGLGPAIAVVDRDFDSAADEAKGIGLPVVAYDAADLEAMLWESPVLDSALSDIASERKLVALGGVSELRTLVDTVLLPIERLRTYNARERLGLDFDSIDLRKKVRVKDMRMRSVPGLCDSLRRTRTDINMQALVRVAETGEIPTCPSTNRPLIHGKDRVAVLGVALQHLVGSLSHQQTDVQSLCPVLYGNARREMIRDEGWFIELEDFLDNV